MDEIAWVVAAKLFDGGRRGWIGIKGGGTQVAAVGGRKGAQGCRMQCGVIGGIGWRLLGHVLGPLTGLHSNLWRAFFRGRGALKLRGTLDEPGAPGWCGFLIPRRIDLTFSAGRDPANQEQA